jgi:hypothetical protein
MYTFPDVAPMATIAMKMSTFVSVAQLEPLYTWHSVWEIAGE